MQTIVICKKCEKLNRIDLNRAKESEPVCGHCHTHLPVKDGIQELDTTLLNKLIKSAKTPIVTDFWAPWCAPCRAFAPTFQKAARSYGDKMIFVKVNTEAHPDAGGQFQIRSIPTLVVFKQGQEADRQSGAMPYEMLEDYLRRYMG